MPMPYGHLRLLARSAEDLPALSALLQDATLRVADIGHDRRRHRMALIVNRYRHEAQKPSRVRSALRIETVLKVQRLNWPHGPDAVLALLGLASDGDLITLAFAAGIAIRCRTEAIELVLEDMDAPWATSWVPRHD